MVIALSHTHTHQDNQNASSRDSITMIRCGCAGNLSGPTFFLLAGTECRSEYTDAFLRKHGAAPYSTIIMTPSAFLTSVAWRKLIPLLEKGIRHQLATKAAELGVNPVTIQKLLVGLSFDGFKVHTVCLKELEYLATKCIRVVVEDRDSSSINQAFDKYVAKSGKKRAYKCLDQLRRSHIGAVIDQWQLVHVSLAMLRDCDRSNVWENSFIAVNMHPVHRVGIEDWLAKINDAVEASSKFEEESFSFTLPKCWTSLPKEKRDKAMSICAGETWDVDVIARLRQAGLGLTVVTHIYKIYMAQKAVDRGDIKALNESAADAVAKASAASVMKTSELKR